MAFNLRIDQYEKYAPLHLEDQLRDADRAASKEVYEVTRKVVGEVDYATATEPALINAEREAYQKEIDELQDAAFSLWPELKLYINDHMTTLIKNYNNVNLENHNLREIAKEDALKLQNLQMRLDTLESPSWSSPQADELKLIWSEVTRLGQQRRENENDAQSQLLDLNSRLVVETTAHKLAEDRCKAKDEELSRLHQRLIDFDVHVRDNTRLTDQRNAYMDRADAAKREVDDLRRGISEIQVALEQKEIERSKLALSIATLEASQSLKRGQIERLAKDMENLTTSRDGYNDRAAKQRELDRSRSDPRLVNVPDLRASNDNFLTRIERDGLVKDTTDLTIRAQKLIDDNSSLVGEKKRLELEKQSANDRLDLATRARDALQREKSELISRLSRNEQEATKLKADLNSERNMVLLTRGQLTKLRAEHAEEVWLLKEKLATLESSFTSPQQNYDPLRERNEACGAVLQPTQWERNALSSEKENLVNKVLGLITARDWALKERKVGRVSNEDVEMDDVGQRLTRFSMPDNPQGVSLILNTGAVRDTPLSGDVELGTGEREELTPEPARMSLDEREAPTGQMGMAVDSVNDMVMQSIEAAEPGRVAQGVRLPVLTKLAARSAPGSVSRESSVASSYARSHAAEKVEFLVSGKPIDGTKTKDVDDRLIEAVTRKIAQWVTTNRGRKWAKGIKTMRCVDLRVRAIGKQAAPDHPDPEHKTACPYCVRMNVPCVMTPPEGPPVVLPLPRRVRPATATPRDMEYYILCWGILEPALGK